MPSIEKDVLTFRFPEIHENAVLRVKFHRTLRIPDDNNEYPLPPSLGNFPLEHVDDHKSVPEEWKRRGGIMMPMWQSEAMWISFDSELGYPFAVKIAAGKVNAVNGESWNEELVVSDKRIDRVYPASFTTEKNDYVTIPKQKWIDGFHIDADHIRQFVAMPLGSGYTVEEQITGKAEFGGVQIIVYPMKSKFAESRLFRPSPLRCASPFMDICYEDQSWYGQNNLISCCAASFSADEPKTKNLSMGLAAGGVMKQQIFADPYSGEMWETDIKQRCFIHLMNSEGWEFVTGTTPSTKPFGPSEYSKAGYAWFEYYDDGIVLGGSKKLRELDSVASLGVKKGEKPFEDNKSTNISPSKIVKIGKGKPNIRDGKW